MAALTDLSDLINRVTGGNSGAPEFPFVTIAARIGAAAATVPVAGQRISLWRYNKSSSGQGAVPTTVAVPTNATTGAFPFTNPSGGRVKKLLGGCVYCSTQGSLILYDRLLHIGGLDGTVTTAQTVGGTLTRNTGGIGNQIWVEIYTQIGASTTTVTASYTDQGGAGGTTPTSVIGNTGFREGERIIPLSLADGDTGVQGVTSVTIAATTGTAGNFGITVARPLAIFPIANVGQPCFLDFITDTPGIRELEDNSCLAWAYQANSTVAPESSIQLSMIEA